MSSLCKIQVLKLILFERNNQQLVVPIIQDTRIVNHRIQTHLKIRIQTHHQFTNQQTVTHQSPINQPKSKNYSN